MGIDRPFAASRGTGNDDHQAFLFIAHGSVLSPSLLLDVIVRIQSRIQTVGNGFGLNGGENDMLTVGDDHGAGSASAGNVNDTSAVLGILEIKSK